jgi:hypothetical protein
MLPELLHLEMEKSAAVNEEEDAGFVLDWGNKIIEKRACGGPVHEQPTFSLTFNYGCCPPCSSLTFQKGTSLEFHKSRTTVCKCTVSLPK